MVQDSKKAELLEKDQAEIFGGVLFYAHKRQVSLPFGTDVKGDFVVTDKEGLRQLCYTTPFWHNRVHFHRDNSLIIQNWHQDDSNKLHIIFVIEGNENTFSITLSLEDYFFALSQRGDNISDFDKQKEEVTFDTSFQVGYNEDPEPITLGFTEALEYFNDYNEITTVCEYYVMQQIISAEGINARVNLISEPSKTTA